jgi:hypothetical protein
MNCAKTERYGHDTIMMNHITLVPSQLFSTCSLGDDKLWTIYLFSKERWVICGQKKCLKCIQYASKPIIIRTLTIYFLYQLIQIFFYIISMRDEYIFQNF